MKRLLPLLLFQLIFLDSLSPALADNSFFVEINSLPFSGSLQSLPSQPAAVALPLGAGGVRFEIPLPGREDRNARLKLLKREQLRLDVLDAQVRAGERREFFVDTVSDFEGIEGILISSPNNPAVGVHGIFFDSSYPLRRTWSLTPLDLSIAPGVLLPHQVSEDEIPQDRLFEPRALLEKLESQKESVTVSMPSTSNSREPAAQSGIRQIELMLVASGDYTRNHRPDRLSAETLAIVAAANIYFEPLSLELKLNGLQIYYPGAGDPFRLAPFANEPALAMLYKVQELWLRRFVPEHDLVGVLARSNYAGVFGLAYPESTCIYPEYRFLFATQGGNASYGLASFGATLAHEVGHSIGMGHDPKLRPEGPSLMWPFFVEEPNGFSQDSINEFRAHEARGGAKCFSVRPGSDARPPTGGSSVGGGTLSGFAGGPRQRIEVAEGQQLSKVFRLEKDVGGVTYKATGLPPGAEYGLETGLLTYTPDYETASAIQPTKTFLVQLTAVSSFGSESTAELEIAVRNVNRLPEIFFSGSSKTSVRADEPLQLTVQARDPDEGDRVKLELTNRSAVQALPGRPQIAAFGAEMSIIWSPPVQAQGTYFLTFRARDSFGAEAHLVIELEVLPPNRAPVLSNAPANLSAASQSVFSQSYSAEDPEGAELSFAFLGLPPGSIVTTTRNSATFSFIPEQTDVHEITVIASDGVRETAARTKVTVVPALSTESRIALEWPGKPRDMVAEGDYSGDGRRQLTLYEPETGAWRHFDCQGSLLLQQQFGGFVGDLPLSFILSKKTVPAVYRLINGQGWWFYQDGAELRSEPWGLPGDIPVPGDYDGDGTTDFVVYRPQTGEWYLRFSSIPPQVLRDTPRPPATEQWLPLSGDVDGDGLADRIFFARLSDGSAQFHVWFADGKRSQFVAGKADILSGVVPLVTDLDGDGRSDLAFRSGTGAFSWFLSSTGAAGGRESFGKGQNIAVADCRPSGHALMLFAADTAEASLFFPALGVKGQPLALGLSAKATTLPALNYAYAFRRSSAALNDTNNDRASDFAVRRPDIFNGRGQWLEQQALARGFLYRPIDGAVGHGVAGDYFGEGRAMLGFFDEGQWISQRPDGSTVVQQWGIAGDIPVPADYNGDGKTEYAVYRPGEGTWWFLSKRSDGSDIAWMLPWGQEGDIPVPADYDGDGAADLAVWRPSTGEWLLRFADGRVEVFAFGAEGDLPLPGRYTGEGTALPALYRPSLGLWLIRRGPQAQGVISEYWGLSGDIPVVGDYDGDGRDDLTVWRPAEGTWYTRRLDSLDRRITIVQFGLPEDLPLGAVNFSSIF